MITVENLTKQYAGVPAVDGISFSVDKGDILGFLGPNGAGKTTTMRMLTSFLAPTSGKITIAGYDAVRQSLDTRKLIGYLPENAPSYPEMRISEYLKFKARLKGVPAGEVKAKLDEVLEKCRIKDVANRIIGQLSKGYRQRVALADAIIHNPSILILDEPTIGLDPHQIRQTRELIKELATERTIILSTHILPEVEMICNRVIIINHGKIAAMDTLANLVKDAAGRQKVKLEVRGPAEDIGQKMKQLSDNVAVSQINGWNSFTIDTNKDIREEIYNVCVNNKWTIRELRIEKETLEDLFIRVTAGE